MALLDGIRKAFLTVAKITTEELEQRLEHARGQHVAARFEREQAEEEALAASLAAPLDDVGLARLNKSLEAKRAREQRWGEQAARLEGAVTAARERDYTEQQAEWRAKVDGLAGGISEQFAELDGLAQQYGEAHARLEKSLNVLHKELATQPKRIRDLPILYTAARTWLIFRRAYASGGEHVYGDKRGASMWEAEQAPSLAVQAAAARKHLMAQLEPREAGGPRAA